jgi:hypothetical protein
MNGIVDITGYRFKAPLSLVKLKKSHTKMTIPPIFGRDFSPLRSFIYATIAHHETPAELSLVRNCNPNDLNE